MLEQPVEIDVDPNLPRSVDGTNRFGSRLKGRRRLADTQQGKKRPSLVRSREMGDEKAKAPRQRIAALACDLDG